MRKVLPIIKRLKPKRCVIRTLRLIVIFRFVRCTYTPTKLYQIYSSVGIKPKSGLYGSFKLLWKYNI